MVHQVQLARLNRVLGPDYNLECLEAPFPSQAGPGVLPFFDGCGPFKRWIKGTASVTEMKAGTTTNALPVEVEDLVRNAVNRISSSGGKVIGLIGFSQGTRVIAGLLKSSEIVKTLKQKDPAALEGKNLDWCDWTFGISVCGSYPPALLAPSVTAALASSSLSEEEKKEVLESKITMPVFHVQGAQDEWKWASALLLENCYDIQEGKSVMKEWEMGHHYPTQPEESEEIAQWVAETVEAAAKTAKPYQGLDGSSGENGAEMSQGYVQNNL